ncbi:alpha/beta hydrolase [Gordonia caeni]|uniref:Alpha/beta fold hydrolase n=1 Tax=Gordonia caeni TaxID=1007097 RepID=A0ABP7NLG7_9ACTN
MSRQYYRDQKSWRDLQRFLPERLRLTVDTEPDEEFWDWRGNDVHLDCYRNPVAPAKVLLHHGVGTNGRQMTLILGAPLARRGYEVISVDDLGYGMTGVAPGGPFTYADWVQLTLDLIAAERARDDRPIVLYGLSAGGMLAYHVAAALPKDSLAGIVGMTFLDQRVRRVRDGTAHDLLTSRLGVPAMGLVADTPLGRLRYPMRAASKMSKLVNNREAMRVLNKDKSSASNAMTLAFLSSYMTYAPATEPAEFDTCPVLLTQPAEDRWTPEELSEPVLSAIRKVPVEVTRLAGAGHYPLEDPGLHQLEGAVADFVARTTA